MSKARPILIDLADIPKNWNIDKWMEYYKQTGNLIFNSETITKTTYERRQRKNIK